MSYREYSPELKAITITPEELHEAAEYLAEVERSGFKFEDFYGDLTLKKIIDLLNRGTGEYRVFIEDAQ